MFCPICHEKIINKAGAGKLNRKDTTLYQQYACPKGHRTIRPLDKEGNKIKPIKYGGK